MLEDKFYFGKKKKSLEKGVLLLQVEINKEEVFDVCIEFLKLKLFSCI